MNNKHPHTYTHAHVRAVILLVLYKLTFCAARFFCMALRSKCMHERTYVHKASAHTYTRTCMHKLTFCAARFCCIALMGPSCVLADAAAVASAVAFRPLKNEEKQTQSPQIYMQKYKCECMCVREWCEWVCVCVRAWVYACVRECARACVLACARECVYVHARVSLRALMLKCMHEWAHVHVHAYFFKFFKSSCACVRECARACMSACMCMMRALTFSYSSNQHQK